MTSTVSTQRHESPPAPPGVSGGRRPTPGLSMAVYLVRRLIRLAVSLIVVSLITFGLLQLVPGTFQQLAAIDAGGSILGGGQTMNLQTAGNVGASTSPWLEYLHFMRGILTWNMGQSYKYPALSVEKIIEQAFPVSLSLALFAILITLVVALPVGLVAAVKKSKFADYGPMAALTSMAALPGYLAAIVLILIFAAWLGWLPTGGWGQAREAIIPILALAFHPTASLARYVRSSVLENLSEEYVVAAYAKGGSKPVVLTRHVLRNSLIPLATVVGPMFAHLATGTVFIEALMGIPGLGEYFTVAAQSRDIPLLLGTTMLFAFLLMVMNVLVDLSYRVLDPRIRYQNPLTRHRRAAATAAVPAGGAA